MALNASLHRRVRQIQERMVDHELSLGIAERLRQARERWDGLTEQQRAAERCRTLARDVAELDRPEPHGDDLVSRLLRARRSSGRRHLAALASLHEPDLLEPAPLEPNATARDMEARCDAVNAWSQQLHNRKAARQHLADLALAGDLLKETP